MEKLFKPGEVLTETITVITFRGDIDITNFALEVSLYEDIFSNVMSGHIIMDDSANLINTLLYQGVQLIQLDYRTPGIEDRVSGVFSVTAIDERTLSDNSQKFVIHFISQEGYIDNLLAVSKKFTGKTDDVISEIFSEFLFNGETTSKGLTILENHNSSVSLVSPYWSPLKIINWITHRSYSNAPSVLFFEGNKSFYLTSIEKLFTGPIKGNYYYGLGVKNSIVRNFVTIKELAPINVMDTLKGQDFGLYGSLLITHDITTKSYKEHSFDYTKDFYNFRHSERNGVPLFPLGIPKNLNTLRRVKTKQQHLFSDYKDPMYENWIMQRNTLINQSGNLRLTMIVPGRTDLEVGDMIFCSISSAISKSPETTIDDAKDPFLTGKYLITAIHHKFHLNGHEMTLEVMKDTYSGVE